MMTKEINSLNLMIVIIQEKVEQINQAIFKITIKILEDTVIVIVVRLIIIIAVTVAMEIVILIKKKETLIKILNLIPLMKF